MYEAKTYYLYSRDIDSNFHLKYQDQTLLQSLIANFKCKQSLKKIKFLVLIFSEVFKNVQLNILMKQNYK